MPMIAVSFWFAVVGARCGIEYASCGLDHHHAVAWPSRIACWALSTLQARKTTEANVVLSVEAAGLGACRSELE